MEPFVRTPTIDFKVPVKRQNVAGLQFTCKMDQTSIGKVHLAIAILHEDCAGQTGRSDGEEAGAPEHLYYRWTQRFFNR